MPFAERRTGWEEAGTWGGRAGPGRPAGSWPRGAVLAMRDGSFPRVRNRSSQARDTGPRPRGGLAPGPRGVELVSWAARCCAQGPRVVGGGGGCWPEPGPGSDRWVPGLCILPRFLRRRPRVPVAEHVDGTFGRCCFRRSEVSHPRQAGEPRRPGTLLSRSQAPAPPFLPGSPWPLDLCRNEDSTSGLDALSRGQLTPGTPLGPPPPALALESLGRKQCKL